jgi:putative hydrolase of the HAD superfamily
VRFSSQTLFIDADDTLWENNVYFEAVVHRFCNRLAARGIPTAEARDTLLAIERVRTRSHGYGIGNFGDAMREARHQLLGSVDPEELAAIEEDCAGIRRVAMELIPGVARTLRELCGRHRVILLTKGDPDDQLAKVHRSGLRRFLHSVDVVKEKDVAAYRDAIARHGVRPDAAWMIGNSPRSDVLPAIAAGLGAVFVPHPATWALEMQELPPSLSGRFLRLERFEQLVEYF